MTSWAPLLHQTENLPSGSGGALFRLSGPNNRIPCTDRPSKTQIALFGSKRPLFRVSASRWRIYRPKDRRLVVAKTGLNVIGVCMSCDSDNKKRPPSRRRAVCSFSFGPVQLVPEVSFQARTRAVQMQNTVSHLPNFLTGLDIGQIPAAFRMTSDQSVRTVLAWAFHVCHLTSGWPPSQYSFPSRRPQ